MVNRMGQPEHIGEILARNQLGRLSALTKTEGVCKCGTKFYTWSGENECKKCRDDRFYEEERQKTLAEMPRIQKETRLGWLEKSGIPDVFRSKTFDDFDSSLQPKAFKSVLRFDEKKSAVLLSPGVYGVGKTHLVCALVNKIIASVEPAVLCDDLSVRFRICPVKFMTENEMLRRIRNSYNRANLKVDDANYEETEQDIYADLERPQLIVIDDVGKVRPRDLSFTQGVYFNIIDERYSSGRAIILTTNLDFTELEAHIGGACADRLREMCGKDGFVKMAGKSYRQK